jgi:CO dehydrogenase/acetyl-CoA synthase beta subunit
MTKSIKSRVDTSNSNKKKSVLNTSNSNKSLKELRETNANKGLKVVTPSAIYHQKQNKENEEIKEEKKGTIMVKSIKNKIVGSTMATKGYKEGNLKKK